MRLPGGRADNLWREASPQASCPSRDSVTSLDFRFLSEWHHTYPGAEGHILELSHDALTCPRPAPYKTAGRMHETQPSLSGGKRHLSLRFLSVTVLGFVWSPRGAGGGCQVAAVTPCLGRSETPSLPCHNGHSSSTETLSKTLLEHT